MESMFYQDWRELLTEPISGKSSSVQIIAALLYFAPKLTLKPARASKGAPIVVTFVRPIS
jgi:hypothetical protein